MNDKILIETEYFGSIIEQYQTKSKCFLACGLSIIEESGLTFNNSYFDKAPLASAIKSMILFINEYLRSRPFTIVKYELGKYQLLDPNGMDYIGQYVSLIDAKKTSFYNYWIYQFR
ncbi:MAG: hypothetical protein C0191_04625 [Mucilaginibacter sp.]|nr:MAG: hypothetical protein C0191_04625 [Mucilaginibacter sp.]HEK22053.1 hypothetical protein [Bacteroidota bacterium]